MNDRFVEIIQRYLNLVGIRITLVLRTGKKIDLNYGTEIKDNNFVNKNTGEVIVSIKDVTYAELLAG